jgi:hypothetical protein
VLDLVLGLPLKVVIGEDGEGGWTAGEGRYTRLYSTCCSFFPLVLFPFTFSFCSALAGAALNSFLATLTFSFFDSSLCFRGGVGR